MLPPVGRRSEGGLRDNAASRRPPAGTVSLRPLIRRSPCIRAAEAARPPVGAAPAQAWPVPGAVNGGRQPARDRGPGGPGLPERTEERTQLRREQFRLLSGGEVAAPRHLGPPRDVVGPLGPLARAGDGVLL